MQQKNYLLQQQKQKGKCEMQHQKKKVIKQIKNYLLQQQNNTIATI